MRRRKSQRLLADSWRSSETKNDETEVNRRTRGQLPRRTTQKLHLSRRTPHCESMSLRPVTLAYWSIRGLAQPIRLLLEYTKIAYEDKKYDQGPAPDFDKSCWFDVRHRIDHRIE